MLNHPEFDLITVEHSAGHSYFANADPKKNPIVHKIFHGKMKNNPRSFVKTPDGGHKRLSESDTTVFFASSWNGMRLDRCKFTKAKTEYLRSPVGFMFPMDSPYVELFAHRLLRIQEAGLWKARSLFSVLKPCPPEEFKSLGHENLISAAVVIWFGMALSAIAIAIEIFCKRCIQGI